MTALTPERLAEIRANLPDPSADLSRRERDSHALLTHVDHLTADNARLREGVAQIEAFFDPIDYDGGLPGDAVAARNVARSLLNPPTEGETDE